MIKDTLVSVWAGVKYFFKINLRFIANLIMFANPFVSAWLVYTCYQERGYFAVGGEIFVPMLLFFVSKSFTLAAETVKHGSRLPVPRKRFTERGEDGAVLIDNADLHEMIVYMGELEDWMESVGKL